MELLSAQVTVTTPSELALYAQAFDRLKDFALYGAQTRAPATARTADSCGSPRLAPPTRSRRPSPMARPTAWRARTPSGQ
ncbi:hypothetical protein ACWCXH_36165 [Kitasatospora sp. NPDC001660]